MFRLTFNDNYVEKKKEKDDDGKIEVIFGLIEVTTESGSGPETMRTLKSKRKARSGARRSNGWLSRLIRCTIKQSNRDLRAKKKGKKGGGRAIEKKKECLIWLNIEK